LCVHWHAKGCEGKLYPQYVLLCSCFDFLIIVVVNILYDHSICMLNLALLMMFQVWNTELGAEFNLHGLICQAYAMEIIDDILFAGGK
jgi:hypothetical protein